MGTNQHFIPVFITKAFSGPGTLNHLASTASTIRAHYLKILSIAEKSREQPLAVLCKNQSNKQIQVRPTRAVCVTRHLYSLPETTDSRERGIALSILSAPLRVSLPQPTNDAQLLSFVKAFGALPVAREAFEDILANEIDTPMARIVARIRRNKIFITDDIPIMARYLTFAMFRTPHWVGMNRIGLESRALDRFNKFIPVEARPEDINTVNEFLGLYAKVYQDVSYLQLISTMVDRTWRPRLSHGDFHYVLFDASNSTVAFIATDNQARLLNLDAPHKAYKRPMPGLNDSTTFLLYPIAPSLCIGVSRKGRFKHISTVEVDERFVRNVNTGLLHLAVNEVILPNGNANVFRREGDLFESRPFQEVGPSAFEVI